MLGQRRFGKIQTALLVVIALVIGASLISPAVGHVKKSLKHLYKHLDPRYYNVGETVANATNATNATNTTNLGGKPASEFVQKTDTFTRNWSCAGTDWDPYTSLDNVQADGGSGRWSNNNGLFRCSVAIPDGAIVTATHFAIRDAHATENVGCEMWRTNAATAVGGEAQMSSVSSAGTPGNTRISDTTINNAAIDNNAFAYFVQCFLGTTTDTRIFGGNVAYTITGGQGAGRVAAAGEADTGISGSA